MLGCLRKYVYQGPKLLLVVLSIDVAFGHFRS